MFVIVALPDGGAGGISQGVDAFGGGGFERPHDGGYRTVNRFAELFDGGVMGRRWGLGHGMPCPYIIGGGVMGNHQDAVDMVWHDDECIQLDMREMVRYVRPTLVCDATRIVQPHLARHHLAEQTQPVLGTDGHKIRPRLRVIVFGQANAAAVVLFGIVFHRFAVGS